MEPLRTCLACRQRAAKPELIRLVFDPQTNKVVLDRAAILPGRGCYLHPQCLDRPGLAKTIGRALRRTVDPAALNETFAEEQATRAD